MTERWRQGGVLSAIALAVAVILPFQDGSVGYNQAFMPTVLGMIIGAYSLTALLLFRNYQTSGNVRMLGLGGAYVFGALAATGYALSFPGITSPAGILAVNPSTSVYWWRIWHIGYPMLVALTYLTEGWVTRAAQRTGERRRDVAAVATVTTATVVLLGALLHTFASTLPVAIVNNTFQSLWTTGFALVIAANALAFGVVVYNTKGRGALERGAVVVLAAFFGDSILGGLASERWTVGWYSSRLFAMVAATAILLIALNELSRLYRKSEDDKRYLEDTTLALLREKRSLQALELRTRSVIQNAADAYLASEGIGLITDWNNTAAELTGYSAQEAIGRPLLETLVPTRQREVLLEQLQDFVGSGERNQGRHFEAWLQHRDGRHIPIEMTVWVEPNSSQRLNFFLRDITDRRIAEARMAKALEEERELVARLQELDKAKTDFVSNISHELRSPLTSTLGFLEVLADGDAGPLGERQKEMVVIAERNARRLQSLIEDLLTLSRIESGSFGLRFRPVSLTTVVQSLITETKASADDRGITLTYKADPELGECGGDAGQLTKALSNVIGNAIKFTEPGGKVDVTVKREAEELSIVVRDTGIGVPAEELSQLFDRFFRASVAIERQYQGAGLGLTIARAIVEHHGGSIEMESELGFGTKATVTVPAFPLGIESHGPWVDDRVGARDRRTSQS